MTMTIAEIKSTYEWKSFDINISRGRALPKAYRYVLVQCSAKSECDTPIVAVGYLKFAAGDKQCPYFVVPGVGGEVIAWSDCLGDNFYAPLWKSAPRRKELPNDSD